MDRTCVKRKRHAGLNSRIISRSSRARFRVAPAWVCRRAGRARQRCGLPPAVFARARGRHSESRQSRVRRLRPLAGNRPGGFRAVGFGAVVGHGFGYSRGPFSYSPMISRGVLASVRLRRICLRPCLRQASATVRRRSRRNKRWIVSSVHLPRTRRDRGPLVRL